jgi:hypothetical protein
MEEERRRVMVVKQRRPAPLAGAGAALVAAVLLTAGGCHIHGTLPQELGVRDMWCAMHFLGYGSDRELEQLEQQLPALARVGVNVIILEVDYGFRFRSHPELSLGEDPITEQGARRFARACRANGIRLIVELQCLGHQSWEEQTFPLLSVYPELDLTPDAFPGNDGLYCREWDPTNPRVYELVFPLMDELIDAFEVDAMHVGMDEVFLLGDASSPATVGKNPAELYAKAVNDIYQHVVVERGLEMLMWGDRLLDAERFSYGEWEAAANRTAPAVDMIPKDIIICDWHYRWRRRYPSVDYFADKGFRVLPTSWKSTRAARALFVYSLSRANPKVLGHLFTRWQPYENPATYRPMTSCLDLLRDRNPP